MIEGFVLIVSLLLSGAWLAGAGSYIDGHIGWENLTHQHPTELAALMAGVFAPLALLWLLVAYFRQASGQRQLAFALKQLHWQARKSAEQTETIVRTLAETHEHERHAAALDVADRALADLHALTARLALGFGRLAPCDLTGLWQMTRSGDRFAFFRALLGEETHLDETRADLIVRLGESPDLKPVILDFIHLQERLSDFAAKRAIDPLLREGLLQGPPAKLGALLLTVLRAEPPLAQHRPGPADEANPSAALLASRVAKVLWPQGDASSPTLQSAPPTTSAHLPPVSWPEAWPEPSPPSPAASAARPPSDAAAPAASGNVMPFSPLAPGFPRNPGP